MLFLYLDVLQVFQGVNSIVLAFLRVMLRLCGVTADRLVQPMDTPLIWYLRTQLAYWQMYDNIDTSYIITLVSKKNSNNTSSS